MKLHIFSDLHFDASSGGWVPELAPGADAVVCAGDVCEGLPEAFRFLRAFIPKPTPIITVAGNHSFYRRVMEDEWWRGRGAAQEHDITLLEDEAAVINGVRFVGATLWTDYHLYGEDAAIPSFIAAARHINDHKTIRLKREPEVWFTPDHAAQMHRASVKAIDQLLAEPFDGPSVVLTHHLPHPGSIAARHHDDPLNPAFASDVGWLIARHNPALWAHGHSHNNADHVVHSTRVLNNPHGYGRENVSGFDPRLVVEV